MRVICYNKYVGGATYMLRTILNQKNISLYQLEKASHISHATLNDIYNERINIDNCSISTISKLAHALNISIESLYERLSYKDLSCFAYDDEFDLFKSNALQQLKVMKPASFIDYVLSNDLIDKYYQEKDYPKAFYLMSLINHLSETDDYPKQEQFDYLKDFKLNKIYISKSLYLLLLTKNIKISDVYKNSLKEFTDHNILEAKIDDVA